MKLFRWIKSILALILIASGFYLGNLFFFKPYSIDHYLAKEFLLEMLDSPESLTYLGIFDRFNWFTNHQSKISITGLAHLKEDLDDAKNSKSILLSYKDASLSKQQKITK
ncbi:MAG: DUF885 domain-containing protein, partial [Pseudomonadota bacterium]|nr:DUF885 domain-containing protein [Pseudomonadota bacterium]